MVEHQELVSEVLPPWPVSHSLLASLPPELALTQDEIIQLEEPWQYLEAILAKLDKLEGMAIDSSVEIGDFVTIEGPVWIGPGAKIMHRVSLKGPLYISENVVVGNRTDMRGSYIGPNSMIGEHSTVVRSLVGPHGEMHGMGLRDSMTGCYVHLAATSSTPNTRLDGEFVRSVNIHGVKEPTGRTHLGAVIGDYASVGTSARIMPGVKIGSHSIVGPGVYLYEDLPDNRKVVFRQPLDITEV